MFNELTELLKNAYAPYSNFKVASIIEMKDGTLFKGVNVENASYGATICAERNAINNAIANGYHKGDFKSLYIVNSSEKIAFPCFICRQTISEFMEENDIVFLYNINGVEEKIKVKNIISNPFTSENL